MPNWCENDLTVSGPKQALQTLKRHLETQKSIFDFNTVIPYPERFVELDKISAEYGKNHPGDWSHTPKDGFNQGGYDWCCENWGTKWNASEAHLQEKTRSLLYEFATAWSPPIPVITKLAEFYPELTFTLKYYERGAAYKGTYKVKGNKILEQHDETYRGPRGG